MSGVSTTFGLRWFNCDSSKIYSRKCSTTLLNVGYQLLLMANLQLETLFSDEKLLFQKDHRHLDQLLLLLRLEGKCSLLSLSSILKALEYHPNSVGYLSQFFHSAGQVLPSTLLRSSQVAPQLTVVFAPSFNQALECM